MFSKLTKLLVNTVNIIRSPGKSNPKILICSQNTEPSAQTPIKKFINNKFYNSNFNFHKIYIFTFKFKCIFT